MYVLIVAFLIERYDAELIGLFNPHSDYIVFCGKYDFF